MAENDEHDHESGGGAKNRELRGRKRKRCLIYVLLFAVFQTVIILLLTLTVKKNRSPKFRVSSAAFGAFVYSSDAADPSFDITLYAELGVKNTNFGRYKFDSTTVYLYYNGAIVRSAFVPGWRARVWSTRTIRVQVELSSAGLANRVHGASDLEAGVLPLNSRFALNGEVEVLQVFKRKRRPRWSVFLPFIWCREILDI